MINAGCSSLAHGGVLVASLSERVRDRVLSRMETGGPVHVALGGAEALAQLEIGEWQMIFLDRRLPDLDAEELLEIIGRRYPGIRVVMIDSNLEDCDQGLPLQSAFSQDIGSGERGKEAGSHSLPGMVGESAVMQEVYRLVRLVAPRDTTVLISGPTGSGKELVARAVHGLSPRASNSFSVLNCAAIPESLMESEMFGYARGAFTGAAQNYSGRILAAQGGTLFLDEVGELPLSAQAKLLRFLERKEVQRLGSTETTRVDVRVVAATNRDLEEAVAKKEFREDLLYRLTAFPIELPALADRKEDILPLASHFLAAADPGRRTLLDPAAGQTLVEYAWPGNVRQLQQVLERALILKGDHNRIGVKDLRFTVRGCAKPAGVQKEWN